MNNLIDDETKKLIEQFHVITNKKWIKSVNKGLGSIGYTFERELGKTPDSLYFPDFYGTEIKCTGCYSRYPITLFTSAFDGPTFPEINRLIDKYGYADVDYLDKKVLFANISCVSKSYVSSGYQFKLEIDDVEEKMYLCVYDMNENLIERASFIYLKTLYDHLVLKLSKLAVVYANKKVMNEEVFFWYYKLLIYKLKGFDTFILLLKNGIIKVSIIARISKSGVDVGRYRNKNLVFKIKKYDIGKLFDNIYMYDCMQK